MAQGDRIEDRGEEEEEDETTRLLGPPPRARRRGREEKRRTCLAVALLGLIFVTTAILASYFLFFKVIMMIDYVDSCIVTADKFVESPHPNTSDNMLIKIDFHGYFKSLVSVHVKWPPLFGN